MAGGLQYIFGISINIGWRNYEHCN
ncbi:uncharacterized protein G2W53_011116 [Senna tora]|uniref:Uncharacterized protein n=1 Tax=Senna tora TaxID=362788 RepID=A0A834X0X7_9FABA|nr:uncharacterized protein G2W53_011116 [Senna tora]